MCEKPAGGGTTLLAMLAVGVWWVVRLAWQLLSLLVLTLAAFSVWAAPKVWRLIIRVTRVIRRRWAAHRLARYARQAPAPVAAIEPPGVTWSDLLDKREAHVR